jgi:hypothetical protein
LISTIDVLAGIRDRNKVRDVWGSHAAITVGDEKVEVVVLHPALNAGMAVEEKPRTLFPFLGISHHGVEMALGDRINRLGGGEVHG